MKRRNRKERQAVVDEWQQSGESIGGFCERKKISIESLKRWKKESQRATESEPSFLPVVLAATMQDKEYEQPCRIVVGGAVVIECGRRTSPQALQIALRAVVAVWCPISAE